MRTLSFFFLALFFTGCTQQRTQDFSDDYVLIEFASKLEEDYHKINGGEPPVSPPKDSHH